MHNKDPLFQPLPYSSTPEREKEPIETPVEDEIQEQVNMLIPAMNIEEDFVHNSICL